MLNKKIKLIITHAWPQLLLVCGAVALSLTNIHPAHYLLGWDTTAPELNPSLNLQRIIFSIWQQYRGVGTLDGMAHGANILHWLYSSLLSLVLPTQLIRPLILITLHLAGGLGKYHLVLHIIKRLSPDHSQKKRFIMQAISLTAALFFQYNFMTIQMFYLPLEVFAYHFAALPWGLYLLFRYLKEKNISTLLQFSLVNLAFIGQAHVPSVFIAYAMVVGIALLAHGVSSTKQHGKEILLVIASLIAINALWGFGYLYSAINKASEISQSKINALSTTEIELRNMAWGDWKSVLTFGGFNLDYHDWNQSTNSYELMMGKWDVLYHSNFYLVACALFVTLALLGLVQLLLARRDRDFRPIRWSILLAGFFFLSMIATTAFPINFVSQLFREVIPYFSDIFRFTFTKFALGYACMMGLFIAMGLWYLFSQLNRFVSQIIAATVIFSAITLAIVGIGYPSMTGNFFYPNLWVSVPQEYFSLQTYLSVQPIALKILLLPSPSQYGWTFNTWGHRGSGFIWQMIPQATTDRAFDAWSAANENLYSQLAYAVDSRDGGKLRTLLESYDLSYILIDESIFLPQSDDSTTTEWLRTWLKEQNSQAVWQEGVLTLYMATVSIDRAALISTPSKYTFVELEQNRLKKIDVRSEKLSAPYLEVSNLSKSDVIQFPFASLVGETAPASYNAGSISIPANSDLSGGKLILSDLLHNSYYNPPATINHDGTSITVSFESPVSVLTTQRVISAPSLPPLSVQLKEALSDVYISINGQIFELTANSAVRLQMTNLTPNLPIVVEVYDKRQAQISDDEVLLDQGLAQSSRLEASVWQTALSFPDQQLESSEALTQLKLSTVQRTDAFAAVADRGAENCDLLGRGSVSKNKLDADILYSASKKGSICESLTLYETPTNRDHILRVIGSHISGRGTKLFVENLATHTLALEYLFSDDSYDRSFSLISTGGSSPQNYRINIETKSFGNEVSSNAIDGAYLTSLPISAESLAKITVEPDEWRLNDNECVIEKISSILPTLYALEIKSLGTYNSKCLVSLSQGYDKGWLLVGKNVIRDTILHMRLNGWANSWQFMLSPNTVTATNHNVIVFYWPQIFAFVGYGILITTVIFQFRLLVKQRKEERKMVNRISKLVSQAKQVFTGFRN